MQRNTLVNKSLKILQPLWNHVFLHFLCIAGSKRKAAFAPTNEVDGDGASTGFDDSIVNTVEREIEREISEIRSGKHPSMVQNVEALERAKQKKIDAADRHRKMQIKNINALFDYEVEDAGALYNVSWSSRKCLLCCFSDRKFQSTFAVCVIIN